MEIFMKFRDYLKHFGWSQAEFAREIGVTPDTVSRWRGDPPKLVMEFLDLKRTGNEYVRAVNYFAEYPEKLMYYYGLEGRP